MQDAIKRSIELQSQKLLNRAFKKQFSERKYQRRFSLRTGLVATPSVVRPPALISLSPHFDPHYCISHFKYLAKVIWNRILDRQYKVKPAALFQIPKDSHGHRDIMVFSIPDAAVANLFNRKLRDRNKNLQSPFCYSYRNDRTIFDAVINTSQMLRKEKTFVVQYDFSKYFDSISHSYIQFVIESESFFISPAEKFVVKQFLTHGYARPADYRSGNFSLRSVGVPQGCSLSLFLSNIAAHELDKELEQCNGSFVRFADDIVCTTRSFSDARRIADIFRKHCHYSGISINFEKSPGITLLTNGFEESNREYFVDKDDIGTIRRVESFDYLGHKFFHNKVLMSSKAILRIKKRISKIIYIHLLHQPRKGNFSNLRIGPGFYDWDLVTCINEIRNYVYGGQTERKILSFLDKNQKIGRLKGLMSFYPLVTNVDQFRDLDGWMVSAIRRAHKLRVRLIHSLCGISVTPLSESEIKIGSWYSYSKGIPLETSAPSFVLAWRASRKAYKQYGLSTFEVPSYYSAATFSY